MYQIPLSFAQDVDSISLSTDKELYGLGDTVVLSGTVTGPPGQLVAIQAKDSSGSLILIRVVQADQNGNFVLQFKIPTSASSGDLNISASSKINGYIVTHSKSVSITSTESDSSTVPEFGHWSGVVLIISIILITLFLSMTSKLGIFIFRK